MPTVYKIQLMLNIPYVIHTNTNTNTNIPVVSYDELKRIIDKTDFYIKEKRYKEVSQRLDVSEKMATMLHSIDIIEDKKSNNTCTLAIRVYNTSSVSKLIEAVIMYINKNEYVKNKLEENLELVNIYIDELNSSLKDFFIIKNAIYYNIQQGKQIFLGFNPVNIGVSIA